MIRKKYKEEKNAEKKQTENEGMNLEQLKAHTIRIKLLI